SPGQLQHDGAGGIGGGIVVRQHGQRIAIGQDHDLRRLAILGGPSRGALDVLTIDVERYQELRDRRYGLEGLVPRVGLPDQVLPRVIVVRRWAVLARARIVASLRARTRRIPGSASRRALARRPRGVRVRLRRRIVVGGLAVTVGVRSIVPWT